MQQITIQRQGPEILNATPGCWASQNTRGQVCGPKQKTLQEVIALGSNGDYPFG